MYLVNILKGGFEINLRITHVLIFLCIIFIGLSSVNASDFNDTGNLNLDVSESDDYSSDDFDDNLNYNDELISDDSNVNENIIHSNHDDNDLDNKDVNINSENIEENKLSTTNSYNYYVNPTNGNDNNNGSKYSPFKSVDKAINTASSGQTIYLYEGNYNLNNALPGVTKSLSFTGENSNRTIINGNGKYTVFTVTGSTLTLTNITFINGSGTYGGVIKAKGNSKVIINNCSFQNNKGKNGGVIGSVDDFCNIMIYNSYFINNTASDFGGAILKNGVCSNLTITNSYFSDNIASNKGGAIYIGGETVAKISGTFNKNTAINGGAVYTGSSSKSSIINSKFSNNKAKDTSTNSSKGLGGAVNLAAGDHNITSSIFTSNNAKIGGAVSINSGRKVIISKSAFNSNHASYYGGAVSNYGDGASIDCNFTNNNAENNAGGAIYVHGKQGSYNITSSRFISNKVYNSVKSTYAGAISFAGESGTYQVSNSYFEKNYAIYGGSISVITKDITCSIVNTQFQHNTANFGGAIFTGKNNTRINIYTCNFTDNNASKSGGALMNTGFNNKYIVNYDNFNNNIAQSTGGAIYVQYNSLESKNTQMISNKALNGSGGAIYSHKNSTLKLTTMNIKNNIANKGSAIYNDANTTQAYINKSCIVNNNIISTTKFDARFNWWGANNKNNTSSKNVSTSFPVVFVSSVKTVNYNKTSNITSFKVLLDVYHYNETGQLHVLDQDLPYITVTLNRGLGKYTFNKQQYVFFNLKGNYLKNDKILVATLDSQVNNISSYKANYIKIDSYPKTAHQLDTINITASIYQIDDTKLDCETQVVFKINGITVNATDLLGKTGTNKPTTRIKVINGNIKIQVKLPNYLNLDDYNISLINIGHEQNTSLLSERSETKKIITITSKTNKNNIVESDNDIIEVKEVNQEECIDDKSIEYPIFNDELGDTYEECI